MACTGFFSLALIGGVGCHKKEKKTPKPQTVSVLKLEPQTVRVSRDYVGRTEAFLSVELRPQITGYITGFFFREGEYVYKGQRLFQIDQAPYRATVDAALAQAARADADILGAQAQLARAQDAADRDALLAPVDAIPRQQYADALAEVAVRSAGLQQMQASRQMAEANLEQARVQLSYTTLRAPISGIAGSRGVVTGGLASATNSQPLVTISDSDPMQVRFAVSDADYLRYIAPQAGQHGDGAKSSRTSALAGRGASNPASRMQFKLQLADGSTYGEPGRFYAISRAADAQTDTVEVVLLYANAQNRLRPGQFVEVRTNVELRHNALLIPANSIRETQGTRLVWVLGPDNKTVERRVEAQQRVGNAYLVTSGLQAGDEVIVGGEQKLRPGDTVKPKAISPEQLHESSRDDKVLPEQGGQGSSQSGGSGQSGGQSGGKGGRP